VVLQQMIGALPVMEISSIHGYTPLIIHLSTYHDGMMIQVLYIELNIRKFPSAPT
jgi:hypothetical protein